MIRVKDVIADVAPIDRQHLAGHALVAFHAALAVIKKSLADFFDRNLVCIGSIGAFK